MTKAAMVDLSERIKASLKDASTYPWFPHLTDRLIDVGWRTLELDTGLTIHNYCTACVIAADANAPRNVVASLDINAKDYKATIPIESLPRDIVHQYEVEGISFYTAEEITGTQVLNCLEAALSILKQAPTLLTTVVALVRSLHVIKPESDDYDVSFTDPQIPFSIFLSAPQECSLINHLRIAEAMVHEAMHLQLSLIEKIVPIIVPSRRTYFSPWNLEYRTPQGIVHALYVFRVIDKFMEIISSLLIYTGKEACHLSDRRKEIAEQINQVQTFTDCPDLTSIGYSFVRRLIFNS